MISNDAKQMTPVGQMTINNARKANDKFHCINS